MYICSLHGNKHLGDGDLAPYRTTSYPISQQLHRTGSIVANSTASVTDSIVFYQYFIVCMLPAKLWVRTRLCPRPGHVLWMPPVTDDPCIIQICHQIRHDIVVIQTSRMGYTHCRHDSGDAVCGDPYYRWQCGVTDGDSLWWHCWWHCSVTAGDSLMGHILRRQFVVKVKLLLAMHCVLMVLL